MKVSPTEIPEVLRIAPRVFPDPRGYFFESWNRRRFAESGLDVDFVQDNQSHSIRGTLRGLHYQRPRAQGKLVRALTGRVFDVAVDLRRGSATFGRWVGLTLSADEPEMLWIPPGFAHGFYVLSETADIAYKCTELYSPADEHTLRWDDRTIAIEWPLVDGRPPLLSDKDAGGATLDRAELYE